MKRAKILLVDFYPAARLAGPLCRILESSAAWTVEVQPGFVEAAEAAPGAGDLLRALARGNPDLIFLVLPASLLRPAGALFASLSRTPAARPMVLVMERGEPHDIWALLEKGVADFITPPLRAIDILPRVWRLLERRGPDEPPTSPPEENLGFKPFVGESPALLAEINKIPRVARCDVSVLISGETGTGKELCARAIHYRSVRARKPFIPMNCGAVPIDLMENELFGHARGAFTGAAAPQAGLIEEAAGGTLFLDEVDCLPLLAQVKLLRFLQEGEYRPLGSPKIRHADVRIISATNLDGEQAVQQGRLRRDLYYRLNVVSFTLPPLRERREDIPLLAFHFLTKYTAEFNKPAAGFSPDALRKLVSYPWPGNVRELEHVIERAVVLSEQTVLQWADVVLPGDEVAGSPESFRVAKEKAVAQFERSYIEGLLLVHQGNITQAAQAAQKDRRAFWQLMRKHHIDGQRFRGRTA